MKKIFSLLTLTSMLVSGCIKEITPSDTITTSSLVQTKEGLTSAVNGAYSLFKDHVPFNGTKDMTNMYLRQYFQMADFASDDIACGQVTTDPFMSSFTLNHSPAQTNTRYFWYISYKIINDANTVIEAASKISNPDQATQQLIGECYFLRAFAHFNLVRLFAKPYTVDPQSPGVIIRTSTSDASQKARATVKEVYDAVIADAEKSASLMNVPRGIQFASKEAAWALLSRVNLYKEDNAKAIDYANKVIGSGRFSLETAASFPSLFANALAGRETIFCIAFNSIDDYGKFGSIASMLYSDGNSGWGEEFASKSLRDTMSDQPNDVRLKYIVPLKNSSGAVQKKNGIEIYYVSKFSFQNNSPTLSSPIMFRLAEMYLNRAEAKTKLGNVAGALSDLDTIRNNRGLSASLYNGTVPAGKTALDIVLKERRLELSFEGHRVFDVYRNKQTLNRTYWGYHLPGLKESDINLSQQPSGYANMLIPYTNNRIIYYLPVDEIQVNALCRQNQ
ncbi:RagB/SusD domain-containing protein [Hydrobacter penzbergensis]|uniref:RagB/SusD domain-containing protein n=1 Tax=Hydrobacter penzbergensis TaxID=1235997 RepID=A0A8X8LE04_9BACT|nr:RagB/SusD family nutrient uptake outer membrane protein [Hydrobacter penzbergensis]PQV59386.1 RagB/SusD domain-containing protein [Sediminibacterium magnilacihabitans]SDX05338.1 RagB/SusD domain-containing protein [Hydrobacter penzbergensis]